MVDFSLPTSRVDAAAELPQQLTDDLITGVVRESTALRLGHEVPVTTRDSRVPVLTGLPSAGWITPADVGLGVNTKAPFANTSLLAEEIMAICVIPSTIVDDSQFPLWDSIRPLLAQACAVAIDNAVIFNINKPSTFTASVVEHASAVGNLITGDVFNPTTDNAALALRAAAMVSEQGHTPSAIAVSGGWQYRQAAQRTSTVTVVASPLGSSAPFPLSLAGLGIAVDPVVWSPPGAPRVDATGTVVNSGSTTVADSHAVSTDLVGSYISGTGIPANTEITSVNPGVGYTISQAATATGTPSLTVSSSSVDAIVGDWKKLLIGMRKSFTLETFNTGVISDPVTGAVQMNLLQQDLLAVRITMRLGALIVNPPSTAYTGPRSPFALVTNSGAAGPVGAKAPAKVASK